LGLGLGGWRLRLTGVVGGDDEEGGVVTRVRVRVRERGRLRLRIRLKRLRLTGVVGGDDEEGVEVRDDIRERDVDESWWKGGIGVG
jgi:hypothetical protein